MTDQNYRLLRTVLWYSLAAVLCLPCASSDEEVVESGLEPLGHEAELFAKIEAAVAGDIQLTLDEITSLKLQLQQHKTYLDEEITKQDSVMRTVKDEFTDLKNRRDAKGREMERLLDDDYLLDDHSEL